MESRTKLRMRVVEDDKMTQRPVLKGLLYRNGGADDSHPVSYGTKSGDYGFMNKTAGLIKTIVLVIVGLLILSYFGVNLRSIVESETGQGNFSYVWGWLSYLWNNFLSAPAGYLWQNVLLPVWDIFMRVIESLRSTGTA